MDKIKVLLAEDEDALATIIKESLETRHFEVCIAANGVDALKYYLRDKYDILVLDIMMPDKDGYTLTQEIRRYDEHIPILMLTAKSQISDILRGFKTGANDYLKKPFSLEELIVRIEALLRRREWHNPAGQEISIGKYVFDVSRQQLMHNGDTQSLTFMESQLLLMLTENRNKIVTRSHILKMIWGNDNFFNGRSLDVFISKLRRKLSGDSSVQIINSRGHGYKIAY